MPETLRGRFVWYELLTSDPVVAQSFYTRLIGWGTQPFEGSGPEPYTMWTNKGTPMGGVMRLPEEARKMGSPPHWLAYIGTPKVDDTAAEAKRLGGQIHVPPMDIPTVGRFAVIADPQGATFAAFTPAPSGQPGRGEGPPQVGEFSWNELATTDQQGAFRFYEKLFGWRKLAEHDMGPMGTYLIYGLDEETQLGGIFTKPKEMPGPPTFVLYIRVEDVDGLAGRVRELGGQVVNGPMDVPGGRIVQGVDPQGAFFALHAITSTS